MGWGEVKMGLIIKQSMFCALVQSMFLTACFFCGKEMHLWVRVIFIKKKKNCYSSFPIFISLFSHYACVWLHFYSSFSNWLLTLHLNYVNWKKNWNNFGWFSNELIRFLNWLLSGLLYSGLELCFGLIWFCFFF